MAVAIQQIPAPTFGEKLRAEFVLERFHKEGLSDLGMDALSNVYARLPGRGRQAPLVVSAHLDTVFSSAIALDVRHEPDKIYGPGIGDNALGVAGLFALAWAMRKKSGRASSRLPGDIWLVANVCEEGLGNLRGMSAVVERFAGNVRAYLVLEGMALGQIYHKGLSVKRYRIAIHTPGGHAWVDHGQPSAIHELATLITRLCALPLPSEPRTSLNVGVISGGSTVNSIAAQAECLLDLRSESQVSLASLAGQVEALIQAGNRKDVKLDYEVVGERPAGELPSDHPLVRQAARCLEAQGIQPLHNIGSTDANIPLSRGLPAVCIGLTTGGGAHTTGEYIHTQPLEQGLAQLLELVEAVFQAR
jgi:acetylornithine deacetylase/succinyl-diaminopimelate desuccinylase-like protein